ncbi:MAG: hypothetical protein U1F07_15525 [Rubrivivax sp.]
MSASAHPIVERLRRWLRLPTLHQRHKFALLGVLGMLMVATPLVDVVRRQSQDLQLLLGARAGLDAMARALDVQRALLAHGAAAALVLGRRGALEGEQRSALEGEQRSVLEGERRARQDEVDARMAGLTAALVQGRQAPALEEDSALRADWAALVERIAARRIAVAGSEAAHRLLIEQVLQIMDFLADAGGAAVATAGAPGLAEPRHAARLLLAFTQFEAARAGTPSGDLVGVAGERRRLQAAARRTFALPAGPGTPGAALARARDSASAALRAYLAALDGGDAAHAASASARLSEALAAWPTQAVAATDAALAEAEASLGRARVALLGVLLLLALAQGLLLASLRAGARRATARAPSGAASGLGEEPGSESRQPTETLMRRLRDGRRAPSEEAPPSRL